MSVGAAEAEVAAGEDGGGEGEGQEVVEILERGGGVEEEAAAILEVGMERKRQGEKLLSPSLSSFQKCIWKIYT